MSYDLLFPRCCPVSKGGSYENGCTFSETHDVPPGHRATHPTKYYRKRNSGTFEQIGSPGISRMKWKGACVRHCRGARSRQYRTTRMEQARCVNGGAHRDVNIRPKYQGFNCLHFKDMLEEHEGIPGETGVAASYLPFS